MTPVPVKVIFSAWRNPQTPCQPPVYDEDLVLSDLHGGSMFDAIIDLGEDQVADLRLAAGKGLRAYVWVDLP